MFPNPETKTKKFRNHWFFQFFLLKCNHNIQLILHMQQLLCPCPISGDLPCLECIRPFLTFCCIWFGLFLRICIKQVYWNASNAIWHYLHFTADSGIVGCTKKDTTLGTVAHFVSTLYIVYWLLFCISLGSAIESVTASLSLSPLRMLKFCDKTDSCECCQSV